MKFKRFLYLSTTFAFAFCSCSDDDETGGEFTPTVFNVMGKVEKGPMIRGSHAIAWAAIVISVCMGFPRTSDTGERFVVHASCVRNDN